MAAAFAGMTVLMGMIGIVYNPIVLVVAAVFGVVTYLFWTHGTGRLASRLYERVERQAASNAGGQRAGRRRRAADRGGFGAGPREEWVPPGERGRRRRTRRGFGQPSDDGGGRRRGDRAPRTTDGPTAAEAYRTLDLDPDADQETIKQAYRERVKAVHPDTDGGDEAQFKKVKAAYERLSES